MYFCLYLHKAVFQQEQGMIYDKGMNKGENNDLSEIGIELSERDRDILL